MVAFLRARHRGKGKGADDEGPKRTLIEGPVRLELAPGAEEFAGVLALVDLVQADPRVRLLRVLGSESGLVHIDLVTEGPVVVEEWLSGLPLVARWSAGRAPRARGVESTPRILLRLQLGGARTEAAEAEQEGGPAVGPGAGPETPLRDFAIRVSPVKLAEVARIQATIGSLGVGARGITMAGTGDEAVFALSGQEPEGVAARLAEAFAEKNVVLEESSAASR